MYERRFEALPRQADIVKIYYHGTPKIDSGESILINGIKPPDLQNRKKQMTTPVEGKVYLTPHIDYAIIYCIGANMAGHSLPEKWINENPFGYLFIIDGKSLIDIQPDEDSVGEMIYNKKIEWLNIMAKNYLTSNQLDKVMDGEYRYWAQSGKKLLKNMSDMQKLYLIDNGAHIAHTGRIIPSQAWKFDKNLCPDLKKDGSNFFRLAQRIK